jgi:hypothetical protein
MLQWIQEFVPSKVISFPAKLQESQPIFFFFVQKHAPPGLAGRQFVEIV